MEYNEKLIKQISEASYLAVENSYRYRPIMRFCYEMYETGASWLYKEDIFDGVKSIIENYTLEDCQRDLDYLVSKFSLTPIQDTENATTLEKFKKNLRYQMTDYAVEIERMTINLEEMEVKVSSLEPRLFERIKIHLEKIVQVETVSEQELNGVWKDLSADFKNLNYSYQDFLKKFNEPKTEELMQSILFIEHKNKFIEYIENFIKEYMKYNNQINLIFAKISEDKTEIFMNKLIAYQKNGFPNINPNFDYEKLRSVNKTKFYNLKKWFVGKNTLSEGERLLQATNNIISKITKYASSLMELHGNMVQRKEEYKTLAKLFDAQLDLDGAYLLSGAILGVDEVRHYKGISNLNSDTIIPSYEVAPIEILVEPMQKRSRVIKERTKIIDKTLEKERLLEEYQEEENRQKHILKKFVNQGKIILEGHVKMSKEEREYFFKILERIQTVSLNTVIKDIDPLFGIPYALILKEGFTKIESEDGYFLMPYCMELDMKGKENER